MSPFRIVIVGNPATLRTEAEISCAASSELIGLVSESSEGWCFEAIGDDAPPWREAAIEAARAALCEYVNRRGENVPEGLSLAGLSFWLMEKSDGTTLGNRRR